MLSALALAAPSLASGAEPARANQTFKPVPSLTPAATQRLWKQLVQKRRSAEPFSATEACKPLRSVFYAATDWLRLTTKLAAAPSPCAVYYVSVPPLVADKRSFAATRRGASALSARGSTRSQRSTSRPGAGG